MDKSTSSVDKYVCIRVNDLRCAVSFTSSLFKKVLKDRENGKRLLWPASNALYSDGSEDRLGPDEPDRTWKLVDTAMSEAVDLRRTRDKLGNVPIEKVILKCTLSLLVVACVWVTCPYTLFSLRRI